MAPALIIIDLQNDFVSPNGMLKKKHIPFDDLLLHLNPVCDLFKSQKWPVVVIRSEYPDNLAPKEDGEHSASEQPQLQASILVDESSESSVDAHLDRTHTGKRRFCAPGSSGAEFPAVVQDLVEKYCNTTITKTRYSAFQNTALHDYLQTQKVGTGPIYFAGVTANNCVLTSITAAFHLEYKVFAIRECIGATSPKLALDAFKIIDRYYGSVVSASSLTTDSILIQAQRPRRILYWVSGSIPSWRVMICLSQKDIPYTRKRLHVMSKPKETRMPQFLSINPRGKTPTLIDEDGSKIIESMAILQYLEMYYPKPALMPLTTDKEKYKLVLQRFHESENLHNVFEDIELLFEPSWTQPYNKERVLSTYRNTLKELAIWERYLHVAEFIASDEFTLADIAFYPNLAYLVHRGLDLEREGFMKLKDYCDRVGRMECAVDAMPVGYEKVGKSLFAKIYALEKEGEDIRGRRE